MTSGDSNDSNTIVRKKRKHEEPSDPQSNKEEIWNSLMNIASGEKKSSAQAFCDSIAIVMESWDCDIQSKFRRAVNNLSCDMDEEQQARKEVICICKQI